VVSQSLPGQRDGITIVPKQILISTDGLQYGRGVLDASLSIDGKNTNKTDEIREGTPLAKIGNLWVPVKRTTVSVLHSTTATPEDSEVITVTNSSHFRAGDVITIGANTGLTINSIDYTTDEITVDDDITASVADKVFASGASAGGEICRGFLNQFVKFLDEDNVQRDKYVTKIVIGGLIDENQILGDLVAIRAETTNKISQIHFGDDAGQT